MHRPLFVLHAALFTLAPAVLAQTGAEPPADAPPAATSARPPAPPLPDLPYQSLVKRDASGKVIPLDEPVTWAACRANPTLAPEDRPRVEAAIASRKTECEEIVLRNLDLFESIEAGALEKIEGDARQVMKTIGDYVRPLKPSGGDFCAKLGKDGVLTELQSRFAQKIASEYNVAVRQEIRTSMPKRKNAEDPGRMDLVRSMQLLTIDETVQTHRALVAEAARALPTLALPSELARALEPELAGVRGATDESERIRLARAAMSRLTVDQRRGILRAAIAQRVPPGR